MVKTAELVLNFLFNMTSFMRNWSTHNAGTYNS